jgi:hypothetical protein
MKFESDDFPIGSEREDITEDDYPFIIRDLMAFIEKTKSVERSTSLIDIIVGFSFKHGIDVEIVGDAIADDEYFKSFIQKDCEVHNIFKTSKSEDW